MINFNQSDVFSNTIKEMSLHYAMIVSILFITTITFAVKKLRDSFPQVSAR